MDVKLEPGSKFSIPLMENHTVLAYVFEGWALFGSERESVESVRMAVFGEGDQVDVETESGPVRFMLIAGAPFKEPIVPYGPFVMNTMEEIQLTLNELREGTFIK